MLILKSKSVNDGSVPN